MRKVLSLIPDEHRAGCLWVAALVPVKAVLDLIGVAALIPVIMLVLDPASIEASRVGTIITRLAAHCCPTTAAAGTSLCDDSASLTWWILGSVGVVLIVKVVLSMLIIARQNKVLMGLYRSCSTRLFEALYSRGLPYMKTHNSARLTFNVTAVCYNFVMGHIGAWLSLAGETVFVALMTAALVAYSPRAALIAVCVFTPAMALYLLAVRRPLKEMNRKENDARREQNRLVNEAFRGYSEIRVGGAYPRIRARFDKGLQNITKVRMRANIIQSIPTYLLELTVIAAMTAMVVTAAQQGGITASGVHSSPIFLGICAVALLKLLPAVRSIISAVSAINATSYAKDIISDIRVQGEYPICNAQKPAEGKAVLHFNDKITLDHVNFAFSNDAIISDLSLEIKKGMKLGIRGRTGAGKTTLFNLLLGLYRPASGRILIDGIELDTENMAQWHAMIGYVPQNVFLEDSTIMENVALGCEFGDIDRERVRTALSQAALLDMVDKLPSGMETSIGEAGAKISGGERQRLGIARALYKNAEVLFLDEVTSSLDSATEKEVGKAIEALSNARKDLTIITISHRESTLAFCDATITLGTAETAAARPATAATAETAATETTAAARPETAETAATETAAARPETAATETAAARPAAAETTATEARPATTVNR